MSEAKPDPPICRGCNEPLLPENYRMADGCPCNSPRGINHGLVATNTCTCDACDPGRTGSTRYPPTESGPRQMQPGDVTGHWPPCNEPCSLCDGEPPAISAPTTRPGLRQRALEYFRSWRPHVRAHDIPSWFAEGAEWGYAAGQADVQSELQTLRERVQELEKENSDLHWNIGGGPYLG